MVAAADRVVLPGDGAFADCRRNLDAIPGMIDADRRDHRRARPAVLRHLRRHAAARHARRRARGHRPASTASPARCAPSSRTTRRSRCRTWAGTPCARVSDHPLFDGIAFGDDGWHAYFLHGYHLVAERDDDVAAVADYGGPVTAIVARGTIAGTQFHPEKSQRLGLTLIANFLKWKPRR